MSPPLFMDMFGRQLSWASLYLDPSFTIAAWSAWTGVVWTHGAVADGLSWSASSANITVDVAGTYWINGHITINLTLAPSGETFFGTRLANNGSLIDGSSSRDTFTHVAAARGTTLNSPAIVELAKGDVIQAQYYVARAGTDAWVVLTGYTNLQLLRIG